MQINSPQSPASLYAINQISPQGPPEKPTRTPSSSKGDSALTVAISPEAQAMQKAAAASTADNAKKTDNERAMQQQAQQQMQSQRPAEKSQRIDITV